MRRIGRALINSALGQAREVLGSAIVVFSFECEPPLDPGRVGFSLKMPMFGDCRDKGIRGPRRALSDDQAGV